jgi:hypothetical protein
MSAVDVDMFLNDDESNPKDEVKPEIESEKTSPAVSSTSTSEKPKRSKKTITSPGGAGILDYTYVIERAEPDQENSVVPDDDDEKEDVKLDESEVLYPLCDRTWCKDRDPESSAPFSFPEDTNMEIELAKRWASYTEMYARDYHCLAAMFSPGRHWPTGGLKRAFYNKEIAKLRLQKKQRIFAKKKALKNQRKATRDEVRKEKGAAFDKDSFIKSIDSELVNCRYEIGTKYMQMLKDLTSKGDTSKVPALMSEWEESAKDKVCEKLGELGESILDKPDSVVEEICALISTKFQVENAKEILAQIENNLRSLATPDAKKQKKAIPDDVVQEDAHRASKDKKKDEEEEEDDDDDEEKEDEKEDEKQEDAVKDAADDSDA